MKTDIETYEWSPGYWQAVLAGEPWDLGDPIGAGLTEAEAIEDLQGQLE